MVEKIKVWSFLVSRNSYLDYRTVVAPDFICHAKATSLIARAAGGDLTESGTAIYRQIINSEVGDLTLVFRVIESTYQDMEMEGSGIIKDPFGREIRLIEGLILKDRLPEIKVSQDNFDQIHGQLKEHYRNFWEWIRPESAIASESFLIQCEGECLELIPQKDYQANYNQSPSQPQQQILTSGNKSNSDNFWSSKKLNEFQSEIISVIFSIDGNQLIIRCDEHNDQTVWLCSLNGDKKPLFKGDKIQLGGHPTPVVINHHGEYIATAMIGGADSNIIKIFDINTDQEIKSSEISKFGFSRVNALSFTTNNEVLIVGGKDQKIHFYDIKGGGTLPEILEHSGSIKTISVNSKDNIFSSGTSKGKILVYELNSTSTSATKKHQINGHGTPNEAPVNSLAFSPDGKILASAGDDNKIKFWNPYKGEQIGDDFGQHSAPVNTIVFSPDGKLLASGDDDGTIKIWDVDPRKSIVVPKDHTKSVTSLSFSPDGKTLVSGSKDKTIRLWTKG